MVVNIYGTLRLVTGLKTIRFDLPEELSLMALLDLLVRQYPGLRLELLDESGGLRKDLPLFLNGRNPRLLAEHTHTILQPGDVLSLFSPVSSGRMNVEVLREPGQRGHRHES